MSYNPRPTPNRVEDLPGYLQQELSTIAASLSGVDAIQLRTLHRAPSRPRDGMIILADGTDFNPGAGAGFYGRTGGTWVKL